MWGHTNIKNNMTNIPISAELPPSITFLTYINICDRSMSPLVGCI